MFSNMKLIQLGTVANCCMNTTETAPQLEGYSEILKMQLSVSQIAKATVFYRQNFHPPRLSYKWQNFSLNVGPWCKARHRQ